MDAAIAEFPDIDFAVTWRPYELAPSSGRGSQPTKREAYLRKFAGNQVAMEALFQRLATAGREVSINFEFDGRTSATFEAHRLAEWCLQVHGPAAQHRLVEAQFSMYIERGQPPNSIDAQVQAAEMAGLSGTDARRVLEDKKAYRPGTEAALRTAHSVVDEFGKGIPFYKVRGRSIGAGSKSTSEWQRILKEAVASAQMGKASAGYGSIEVEEI